jgi:ABC-2 type transport system ATP-binding protein
MIDQSPESNVDIAVKIENLTKDYELGFLRKRKVRALNGLSITVNRGEIFGFLGANGAGKTTTLKLLMRLIFPTAGSAQILGHDIADVSMHQRIGYLPENPYFYDYLTAREFLDYCGELFGLDRTKRSHRTEEMMTRVGLEKKSWDRQMRKFSKGMLQRVGLAQALINDPEVVFLDEPMSGLDPIGRREVRDLIASLKQDGKTVFMSSHILSDIEVLCDRVAILKRGSLAHVGNLQELEQGGKRDHVEVLVSCADAARLEISLQGLASEFTVTASGVRIVVPTEAAVDPVIEALRALGGKLISVQPLRQSLEELFLDEAGKPAVPVSEPRP